MDTPHCIEQCAIGQALDGLLVGVVLTNQVGKVVWINREAERVLGIDRGQCLGKLMRKVIHDPQLSKLWHEIEQSDEVIHEEVSLRIPEASELKLNATLWQDPTGTQCGRALLFCDVTQDRSVQLELSQAVAHRLLKIVEDGNEDSAQSAAGLTGQELRILTHLGQGLGNQDIAEKICVSTSTVRFHLKNIYRKLQVNSRSEAVSYAARQGLA